MNEKRKDLQIKRFGNIIVNELDCHTYKIKWEFKRHYDRKKRGVSTKPSKTKQRKSDIGYALPQTRCTFAQD